jgi:hypothetical protein
MPRVVLTKPETITSASIPLREAHIATLATHGDSLADWAGLSSDAWTAVGTIALAGITLITLLVTIVISLRSDAKLRRERKEAQAGEWLAEAYAVQVIGTEKTLIVNRGKYTITGVEGRLKLRDAKLVEFQARSRFLNATGPEVLIQGIPTVITGMSEINDSDILAPWDAGLLLLVDPATAQISVAGSHPVIRWTDRWGNRWQHEKGDIKKVNASDPWPGVTDDDQGYLRSLHTDLIQFPAQETSHVARRTQRYWPKRLRQVRIGRCLGERTLRILRAGVSARIVPPLPLCFACLSGLTDGLGGGDAPPQAAYHRTQANGAGPDTSSCCQPEGRGR